MQLLLNSATLPRKWASSFKKKSSSNSSKPPPGPSTRKSLVRSSSFSHPRHRPPADEGEVFKIPIAPVPTNIRLKNSSDSLSTFQNSPWKSKSFSDLKSQRDTVKMRVGRRPPSIAPPPPPVRNSSCSLPSRSISYDSLVQPPPPPPSTASILNKNLRSTSWRNIFAASSNSNFGGMNRNHRLSQGPKKVNPPSVPQVKYPRSSCSSFGSDQNCPEEAEIDAFAPNRRLSEERIVPRPQQQPSSSSSSTYNTLRKTPKSPGRDSPGHDSNASSVTLGSASSGGCRNSTTSLDSGRASNSATESIRSGNTHVLHHPQIHHHQSTNLGPQSSQRLSYQSSVGSSSNSSFRQSYHSSSSSSSVGSSSIADHDGIYSLNVHDMISRGHPDHEILNSWLTDLHFEEYYDLFVSAGYDMPTISRMTPEDLTAIGIKKPNHRKRLKMEIAKLNIGDGLPEYIPDSLEEWLHCIRLSEYGPHLRAQGYNTVNDASQITIEDLEDVGLFRLGHQKRFLLAVKRNKDLKAGRRFTTPHPSLNTGVTTVQHHHPPYDNNNSSLYRNEKCQFTSFQQPKYHPDIIRIEPTPVQVTPSTLPPDMPRPMAPLQMFTHHRANTFVPRSYDDTDIMRKAEESVLIHNHHHQPMRNSSSNGGDGTLPRPKGYVKPRPIAKVVAKTRENPCIERVEDDLTKDLKICSSSLGRTARSCSDGFRASLRQFHGPSLDSSSTSPPPPAPECDGIIPFANENAGTIRMRSGSTHIHDVSNYDWNPQSSKEHHDSPLEDDPKSSQLIQQQRQAQQPQQQTNHSAQLKSTLIQRQGRTAGDVLNDIGSMLADLTDELDAMLHMDQSENSKNPSATSSS
uniref:SAM domain-containing protein n=2 Tax=Lepeophtheirus salmonis TaxID=72036 RepID=A0A0K2UH39_LEPSM